MGCLFSCSSTPEQPNFVRIVHLSGCIEDFVPPVTASDVTGTSAKHYFLCSSAELLCMGPNRLRREAPLVPGRVYFLLPHSLFDSPDSSSPADLASLAKRLTAAAKRAGWANPQSGAEAVGSESGGEGSGGPPPRNSWKPVLETIMELSRRMETLSFRGLGDGDSYDCFLHHHHPEPLSVAC